LKSLILISVFLFFSIALEAQVAQRQTTASAGAINQFNYGSQKLIVHSSIGQQSVIGASDRSGIQLRQGFIQTLGAKSVRTSSQNNLDAHVFPNPFRNYFFIEFTEPLNANVSILDILGRVLLTRELKNLQTSRIELNNLSQGTYILIVKSGNRLFKSQIIKY